MYQIFSLVYSMLIFINTALYNCTSSCDFCIFILCRVFIVCVCVVLCAVFRLIVLLFCVMYVICVLCLIVVPLPPGGNPFVVKIIIIIIICFGLFASATNAVNYVRCKFFQN
jgi:hypothetical protein